MAFFDEYLSSRGFTKAKAQSANLSQWIARVRVRSLFGTSTPAETRAVDKETIKTLLKRLSKITRHPNYLVEEDSNFDVIIVNKDERYAMLASLSSEESRMEPKAQNF